jgi:hypothetical protein
MTGEQGKQQYNDGLVDAIATVAIIAICVASFVIWLAGH